MLPPGIDVLDLLGASPDGSCLVVCRHWETWREGEEFGCLVCREKAMTGSLARRVVGRREDVRILPWTHRRIVDVTAELRNFLQNENSFIRTITLQDGTIEMVQPTPYGQASSGRQVPEALSYESVLRARERIRDQEFATQTGRYAPEFHARGFWDVIRERQAELRQQLNDSMNYVINPPILRHTED
jgi:hypothetical protein